jgi:hypothetical protein
MQRYIQSRKLQAAWRGRSARGEYRRALRRRAERLAAEADREAARVAAVLAEEDRRWLGATLPFYTVVDCHCPSFLRGLHTSLGVITVLSCEMTTYCPGLIAGDGGRSNGRGRSCRI